MLAALSLCLLLPGSGGDYHPPFPLDRKDPVLQHALVEELEAAGLGKALASKQLTVSVVDLTRNEPTAYAGINDDLMIYAASLPKIALLLAVLQKVNDGDRPLQNGDLQRLEGMINVSSNRYASWAYDVVGPQAVAEILQRPRYGLYHAPEGGLWVGRPFRKGGPTKRDPLFNLSHGATARQAARFYVLLHQRRLVSPYTSELMETLMGPPGIHHKFVGALMHRTGVRFVARKSGSWSTFHADSALIEHHGKTYVLVALADTPQGESLLRRLAPIVDDIIMRGDHRPRS